MKISVIISCFNAEKYIKNCLRSLFASDFNNFEVIAIDDCSSDSTAQILSNFSTYKNYSYFVLSSNRGPSFVRNLASRKAKGEIFLFLDNDTIIDRNCLKKITAFMAKNKSCGGGQCLLLNQNKTVESVGHFLSITGFPYELGVNGDPSDFRKTIYILGAKTAGMVTRKKIFQKIGGFDESMFINSEDTDLSWRVWKTGFTMNFIPDAMITHIKKGDLSYSSKSKQYYEGSRNMLNMILKNADKRIFLLMITLNVAIWLLISGKRILAGDFKNALKIYKGILWNLINLPETIQKRKKFVEKNLVISNKIIFGKISLRKLIFKGRRWFADA